MDEGPMYREYSETPLKDNDERRYDRWLIPINTSLTNRHIPYDTTIEL